MFLYIVLTPISTTSGLWSTGNTRKYQQIDVYIHQCVSGVQILTFGGLHQMLKFAHLICVTKLFRGFDSQNFA